jgi:hypothetical protein
MVAAFEIGSCASALIPEKKTNRLQSDGKKAAAALWANFLGRRHRHRQVGEEQEHWIFIPRVRLIISKQGQLQIDASRNAWRLVDILDRKERPALISQTVSRSA